MEHKDPYLKHVSKKVRIFYDDNESVRKKQGTLTNVGPDSIELDDKKDGTIIINRSRLVRTEVIQNNGRR